MKRHKIVEFDSSQENIAEELDKLSAEGWDVLASDFTRSAGTLYMTCLMVRTEDSKAVANRKTSK